MHLFQLQTFFFNFHLNVQYSEMLGLWLTSPEWPDLRAHYLERHHFRPLRLDLRVR